MDDTYTFYKKGYIFFLITCETFTKKFLSHTHKAKPHNKHPINLGGVEEGGVDLF